jgi:Fur family peroxide stress response transcriptional regulator
MMNRESIVKALREKGMKITPQRLAIIEVLIERNDDHPGAGVIYREARKKIRRISLSTVYATLGELSRRGIIKTLQFDQMENRYEGNIEEHINLICKGCGKIVDFKAPVAVDPAMITKKTGFRMLDSRLEYYGYCRDCAGRPKGKRDKILL